jgi:hypothetical protein
MFFPNFIKWLARNPAPFALGVLWWGESTIVLCTLTGSYLLSSFLFNNLKPSMQPWLFPLALLTYFFVSYVLHFTFGLNSQLMEGLINIHRLGGLRRAELLTIEEKSQEKDYRDPASNINKPEKHELFSAPQRIRASAEAFKIRYFIILPSVIVLYLLSFTSTIYRIFAHQIQTWEPGWLLLPALAFAVIACLCFWLLQPWLPGYVSVRKLIGFKKPEGE